MIFFPLISSTFDIDGEQKIVRHFREFAKNKSLQRYLRENYLNIREESPKTTNTCRTQFKFIAVRSKQLWLS